MHVQVATYRIEETGDDEFIEANREFATMVADVPGLLAKVWLKSPDGDVYGGVYFWRDREAYEAFVGSELWDSVKNDDSLTDLESREYSVMEPLTSMTQPGLSIV